jgi:septation ring formation regulator EzrA
VNEFERAAQDAQQAVATLLAGAEEARARFADVRAQIVAAGQRFDAHWASVTERAVHYLEQVGREEDQLLATREETRQGLEGLRHGLEEVREQGPLEVDQARAEFDEAAGQLAEREPELGNAVQTADDAEQALVGRLDTVQNELEGAVSGTEEILARTALEMEQLEQEIERRVLQLNAYVAGECLPAVMSRAQALYQRLVQAEHEVRGTLEAALEATESAADRALRACRDGFGDALSEVTRLGQALDEALFDVKVFIDGGRAKLQDRRERWDDGVNLTRDRLRDALQHLKEVEAYLAHFSFGK